MAETSRAPFRKATVEWDDGDDDVFERGDNFPFPFYGDEQYVAARDRLIPEAEEFANATALKLGASPLDTDAELRERYNNAWNAAFHARMNKLVKERIYAQDSTTQGVQGALLGEGARIVLSPAPNPSERCAEHDAGGSGGRDDQNISGDSGLPSL